MKKLLPIALGLIALLLFIVGSAAGSKMNTPVVEANNQGELVVVNQSSTLLEEVQSIISLERDDTAEEITDEDQETARLEADFTVTGEVYYCDCETDDICRFIPFDENMDPYKETLAEGDTLRTGSDGTATIHFGNQITLILARNTQVRILKYTPPEDGLVQVQIEQIIGEVYFNVKFSRKNNQTTDFKLLTPTAVIQPEKNDGKQAFSGISLVQYLEYTEITKEQLAETIEATFTNDCGALCTEDNCFNCQTFGNLSPIDLTLKDLTGNILVKYITEDGYRQSILTPGQTMRFIFDGFEGNPTWQDFCQTMRLILNGGTPSVAGIQRKITGTYVSISPTNKCGDGICDRYTGENKNTCPQDCN